MDPTFCGRSHFSMCEPSALARTLVAEAVQPDLCSCTSRVASPSEGLQSAIGRISTVPPLPQKFTRSPPLSDRIRGPRRGGGGHAESSTICRTRLTWAAFDPRACPTVPKAALEADTHIAAYGGRYARDVHLIGQHRARTSDNYRRRGDRQCAACGGHPRDVDRCRPGGQRRTGQRAEA